MESKFQMDIVLMLCHHNSQMHFWHKRLNKKESGQKSCSIFCKSKYVKCGHFDFKRLRSSNKSHKLESILVVQYSLKSLTFAILKLLFCRIFLALEVFDMTAGDIATLRHKVNKISFRSMSKLGIVQKSR